MRVNCGLRRIPPRPSNSAAIIHVARSTDLMTIRQMLRRSLTSANKHICLVGTTARRLGNYLLIPGEERMAFT